jgi:hypothetical protein
MNHRDSKPARSEASLPVGHVSAALPILTSFTCSYARLNGLPHAATNIYLKSPGHGSGLGVHDLVACMIT